MYEGATKKGKLHAVNLRNSEYIYAFDGRLNEQISNPTIFRRCLQNFELPD
jgi:hypothetical protein